MRWFEQYRLNWIAETLRVFGFINREHLERKFSLSTPQASADLARFRRAYPTAMTYDVSAKRVGGGIWRRSDGQGPTALRDSSRL
jgi:hypothetical protein